MFLGKKGVKYFWLVHQLFNKCCQSQDLKHAAAPNSTWWCFNHRFSDGNRSSRVGKRFEMFLAAHTPAEVTFHFQTDKWLHWPDIKINHLNICSIFFKVISKNDFVILTLASPLHCKQIHHGMLIWKKKKILTLMVGLVFIHAKRVNKLLSKDYLPGCRACSESKIRFLSLDVQWWIVFILWKCSGGGSLFWTDILLVTLCMKYMS